MGLSRPSVAGSIRGGEDWAGPPSVGGSFGARKANGSRGVSALSAVQGMRGQKNKRDELRALPVGVSEARNE